MSAGMITTEAELAALPERTAVVDRMGDVGTVLGGKLRYPETSPQTFERAAKKYGPFHIIYSPPVPDVAPGIAGTATVHGHPGVRVVRGTSHDEDGLWWLPVASVSSPAGMVRWPHDAEVTDFAPDATAPTLAQIVDAMCAHDPEHGNGEIGAHTHSHDPADGQCYWAMTVGPQIAHLWTYGGAS